MPAPTASAAAPPAASVAVPVAAPLCLPPRPSPLAVAFVYLRAQDGGDFFADTPFCLAAGELRASGRRADVYEVFLRREDAVASAARVEELVLRLRAGAYGLCVFEHLFLPELVDAVAELGALLLLTEADAELGRRVDLRLLHLANHRQPLHDLVAALESGGDLLAVDNLVVELPGMAAPRPSRRERPHPPMPDALRPFTPVVDVVEIGEERAADGSRPPLRKTLDTNKGCPFSAPIAANPAFAEVPMPAEGVTLAGCAFCFMGGDYKALGWREAVPLHLQQIGWYQAQLPQVVGRQLEEVVLRDQHALRYLPQLVEGAIAAGLQPVGFLLPGRGDAILRFGAELRAAARAAERTGFWFSIYLIGFESFSQAQLDLYNKGVRVEEYAEALRALRALHREHPDSFRLYAHGASSFILWNPWTSLEDIEETVAFARAHGADALAHGIGDTRLRLYRHLPLYWKARHDGLFAAAGGDGAGPADAPIDAGARYTGYAAAQPWRYRDGRLARCEALARALLRRGRPADALGALEAAVAWTRRRWPAPLPPEGLEAFEARPAGDLEAVRAVIAAYDDLAAAWRRQAPTVASASPALALQLSGSAAAAAARRRTVLLGAACNNRCHACLGEHRAFADDATALGAAVVAAARAAAVGDGRVVLAGREPLLLPALPQLVAAARAAGARSVEVVTNGRALALPGVAARLARAGVDVFAIKRHRLADGDEDVASATPGAGAQQAQGLKRWRRDAPAVRLRALLLPVPEAWHELPALVAWAAAQGSRDVTVRVLAGAAPLHDLAAAAAALHEARAAAASAGVRFDVEG